MLQVVRQLPAIEDKIDGEEDEEEAKYATPITTLINLQKRPDTGTRGKGERVNEAAGGLYT